MNAAFPSKVVLGGADYLMAAFDSYTRRRYGNGNVCHLLLKTKSPITIEELKRRLAGDEFLAWLHSLRLTFRVFRPAYWRTFGPQRPLPCYYYFQPFDPSLLPQFEIDPEKESPVAIRVFQQTNQSEILLSWHHTLMDAHGAEMILQTIGTRPASHLHPVTRAQQLPASFAEQQSQARRARRAIFDSARAPRTILASGKKPLRTALRYRRIQFSAAETLALDQVARRHNADLVKSCFYLAAVARATFRILERRKAPLEPLYVPVPHDTRRRKDLGLAFSNQVTFLFFRITADAVMRDMAAATESIVRQMQELIEKALPKACQSFLSSSQWLPISWYEKLLCRPAGGTLASFFFSDTGSSLSQFETFAGAPVAEALHYPPHIAPPGFSTVFSRFENQLTIMVPYCDDIISSADLELFEHSLRADLIGDFIISENAASCG